MPGELGYGLVKCKRGVRPFELRAQELRGMPIHRPTSTNKDDCLLPIRDDLRTFSSMNSIIIDARIGSDIAPLICTVQTTGERSSCLECGATGEATGKGWVVGDIVERCKMGGRHRRGMLLISTSCELSNHEMKRGNNRLSAHYSWGHRRIGYHSSITSIHPLPCLCRCWSCSHHDS
ncbi:hypothetical protein BDN67DRAFT_748821 [Paxillus ammoniavirescens]|nr:hypothetical protein BDN67DRAFT_748821 [Paxillus ammoniavirescens]